MKSTLLSLIILLLFGQHVHAQIRLPSIFGDQMVLQQKQANPVWGWANTGEKITVSINGQTHSTQADAKGYWKVTLRPLSAGGPYSMEIKGASSSFFLKDILVGEVWICSGQSNMEWPVSASNSAELATLTANYPNIRLISVPRVGTQESQDDFKGEWTHCMPQTVKDFSAVGYFFGRRLHHALDVPIGLIDNAWGGSAAEAWIRRDVLEADENYVELMTAWKEQEADFDFEALLAQWEKDVAAWDVQSASERTTNRPRRPRDLMTGNHRPGNIYNGVLHPTIGYGIKGVIWYQGESNAARAYQYRHLFPKMIQHWRDEWKQGDFPFYYVQLADFRAEKAQPGDSDWAELREAQTMTMSKLSNVGEAVIIDVGEGRDIHPRNKQTVADRLARWALARDYKKNILFRGPTFQNMKVEDNKVILTFNNVGKGLHSFDVREPLGFIIAGDDQKFFNAKGKIIGPNKVEIWSDEVSSPAAVRYAWADNPICNMYSRDGLPMTPFRTDTWKGITADRNGR